MIDNRESGIESQAHSKFKIQNSKLLITGGSGFIGSNFIKFVLLNTANQIINIDSLTYAGNLENLADIADDPRYTFIKADITDKEALQEIGKKYPDIDYIINFAAESHVDRSIIEPNQFVLTNVVGTQNMLNLAIELGVKKYLQVSTDEVYGALGASGKFVETMALEPSSPYSASKASADLLVMAYHKTFQLPVNITRCSNNYGPYQFPEKLIPLMINNARQNKSLPVYGTGMNVRDWIYVDDHCRGILTTLERGRDGEVYNFGGDAEKPNLEIVKLILEKLGKSEELITYVEDRKGHDWRYAIDFSKAKTELGWQPQISFEEGMEKTINWYMDNLDWMENVISGEYERYYGRK
ncbi:MAG: dTDP-glucose 4,6-dehydratase [Candidatus Cloacimonetes bacterium]|nr:dTDP-glucose 4,6-dehydratase [Candidatus Cloacimonadota bacterium]